VETDLSCEERDFSPLLLRAFCGIRRRGRGMRSLIGQEKSILEKAYA